MSLVPTREDDAYRRGYEDASRIFQPVVDHRAKLMAALKPFSEAAEELHGQTDDEHLWESPAAMSLKAGDLRAARRAYGQSTQGN